MEKLFWLGCSIYQLCPADACMACSRGKYLYWTGPSRPVGVGKILYASIIVKVKGRNLTLQSGEYFPK